MAVKDFEKSRVFPNPLGVLCPWCFQRPGDQCRRLDGSRLGENRFHVSRIALAKKVAKGQAVEPC